MAEWEDGYIADVMEPARRQGTIPADVVKRYALTEAALADETQFRLRIDAVVNLWRTLKRQRKYSRIAEGLLAAHDQLERGDGLDRNSLRARRDAAAKSALDRLRRQVADLSSTTTLVTPRTLQALVKGTAGFLEEVAVRRVLAEKRVNVVEARPLPTSPPTPKYRDLRAMLTTLGLRLSVELVVDPADVAKGFSIFHGFSLRADPTRRVNLERIKDVRKEWKPRAQDDRKSAADLALTMLAEVVEGGRLDELVLWELAEGIREDLEQGLPVKVLVADLRERGLVLADAELLVLSLVEGAGVAERPPSVIAEIEEALAGGELRLAEQLAATADGSNEGVRAAIERVSAVAMRAKALTQQAESLLARDDTEAAALLLTEAADMARDDEDLQRRVDRLAPPPPTSARLVVDGDSVVLTWTASAARVGSVSYRVLRQRGRAPSSPTDGVVAGETTGTEVRDQPPPGVDVYYGVFAGRRAHVWSIATAVGPVTLTPEISDVRVTAGDRSVAISWRAHPDAVAVHVVRRAGAAPSSVHDGEVVSSQSSLVGLTDDGVLPGAVYYYRISAVYLGPEGTRLLAPGCVAIAIPEYKLVPVRNLTTVPLDHTDPTVVQLEWSPPPHGLVAIRSAARPPAWNVGARISMGDTGQHGTPVSCAPQVVGGRMRAVMTAQSSRSFITAFTCGQHEAVVGNTVEVYVAAPVRALKAERFGPAARLSWIWPDGATSAAVEWRPTDGSTDPGGSTDCLRQAYDREGGFQVVVGAKPVTLSVHAVVNQPEGPVRSPPAEVLLATRPIPVRYRLIRSRLRRRAVRVELWAEEPCDLPPIVVVHRAGKVMPRRPSDGTVLSRIEGITLDGVHRSLAPQKPVRLPSDVSQGWLVCFVESPSTAIRLIAPPAQELKVG